MNEPLSIDCQAELLKRLFRSSAERAQAEAELTTSFARRARELEEQYQEERQQLIERYESQINDTEAEYQQAIADVKTQSETDLAETERKYQDACQLAHERFDIEHQAASKKLEEGKWEAAALYDATKNSLEGQLTPKLNLLNEQAAVLGELQIENNRLRQELELPQGPAPPVVSAVNEQEDPFARLGQYAGTAEALAVRLRDFRKHPVLKAFYLSPMFLAVWFVLMLLGRIVYRVEIFKPEGLSWVGAATGGTVALAVLVLLLRAMFRSRQIRQMCGSLETILRHADTTRERCLAVAEKERAEHLKTAEKRREESTIRREQKYHRRMEEITRDRERVLRVAKEDVDSQLAGVTAGRDRTLRETEDKYLPLVREMRREYDTALRQFDQRHEQQAAELKEAERLAWIDLGTSWRETVEGVRGEVLEINQAANALFPGWMKAGWKEWQPPRQVPPAIRFGEIDVNLQNVPGAISTDPRLKQTSLASFSLPALVPFPSTPALLYKAHGEGREAAVRSLQSVMLRMLTSLPAGKVRFTIIDPIGLGENFAGFMHLADFDESLVSSRIWTESDHIEQRLGDMSEHLENVIQTYLRNEYQTIEEYNREAGEVAEPFRILVVANFPTNFSEKAVRRLISIASSGARCGVYTLITCDTKQKLPPGCRLRDLEQHHTVLTWDGNEFGWQHETFKDFPLRLDAPPPPEQFTSIVHTVGDHSRDANRVELPFENIVPSPDKLWTSDCGSELIAPLGQAGATKLQHLRLGRGTSQHVLVAGKTGSGKSTMLHVLITSLALQYSPEEVELYLVDFKKGVEFKTYATHNLPHARVVAVESEREFGLSVLQRLDVEMKARGDAFRGLGVQDLNSYREASGKSLPRILLIVDEFQELFVEDDRLSSDASLLLDRLVRQGRAFGMHVLLGSQTLGGAYSLARSTLGQMAVRIALECSETDANLILSEGNTAARLLTRPGEAIYNDANGLIEGNKPFQIAWLSDAQREGYLKQVHELAAERGYTPPVPQMVFEGNAPAEIAKNQPLAETLSTPSWPAEAPPAPVAWLGEPVAIKEPTAATFRRQGGSNLLVVGQRDIGALGILASSLLSLAAQHSPDPADANRAAKFYVLDGSRDEQHAGFLAQLAESVPHQVEVVNWRETGRVMGEIAAEVERRGAENDYDGQAIFLLVYDLGRFRDLRRDENDFGFGRMGEDPVATPSQQFQAIIRDGAGLGVHSILWCDTVTNLNRVFDRTALREFEQRVVFQMSGDDSSNLIDTPVATKLGHFRALFHSEEAGSLEKFRPYDLPGLAWLTSVRAQLGRRNAVSSPPSSRGE